MHKKKWWLLAFLAVAVAQLYIPANMIWHQEQILRKGSEYRFKTAPIDPSDIMRGKYVSLRYDETSYGIDTSESWFPGQEVYVSLTRNAEGYATIASITARPPIDGQEYLQAKVGAVMRGNAQHLTINYPFDRYYMEESKAPLAESAYNRAAADSNQLTYAVVSVYQGEGVIKNVFIDNISIEEAARGEAH